MPGLSRALQKCRIACCVTQVTVILKIQNNRNESHTSRYGARTGVSPLRILEVFWRRYRRGDPRPIHRRRVLVGSPSAISADETLSL